MANSDKDILITPNKGEASEPSVIFSGANTTPNNVVTLSIKDEQGSGIVVDHTALSFTNDNGEIFAVTTDFSNSVFGVTDIDGLPLIEAFANGMVSMAEFANHTLRLGTIITGLERELDARLDVDGTSSLRSQSELRFHQANNDYYISLRSPGNYTANVDLRLPNTVPANTTHYVLSANTTGYMYWSEGGGGGGGASKVGSPDTYQIAYWADGTNLAGNSAFKWANNIQTLYVSNTISINDGGVVSNPRMIFSGANTTPNNIVTMTIKDEQGSGVTVDHTSLSYTNDIGEIFAITTDFSNSVFGVTDIDGLPLIEAFANGMISMAEFDNYTLRLGTVITGTERELNARLDVNGTTSLRAQSELRFHQANNDYYISVRSPGNYTANVDLRLPNTTPANTSHYVLSANTSGYMYWSDGRQPVVAVADLPTTLPAGTRHFVYGPIYLL